MLRTETSARLLVGLNLVVYLAYGVIFVLAPSWGARAFGIELTNATALADFRAIYGGLPLGVGLFFAAGLRRRSLLLPAVGLSGICSLEIALARAYSWAASGRPDTIIVAFMVLELGAVIWAGWVFRRLAAAGGRGEPRSPELLATPS